MVFRANLKARYSGGAWRGGGAGAVMSGHHGAVRETRSLCTWGMAYYLCMGAGWSGEQCSGRQESQSGAARKSKAVQGAGACLDASTGSTGFLVAVTLVNWPVERVTVVRLAQLRGGGGGWSGLVVLNWTGGTIPISGVEGFRLRGLFRDFSGEG